MITEFELSVVMWGSGAVIENGVEVGKVSIGPRQEDLTPEQWIAFQKMKHDNSTPAD